MSEPVDLAMPPSLEALRSDGAQRLDPVRFRYLEVLSQRQQDATGEVRRILEGKLNKALADYAARLKQARPTPPGPVKASCLPLAQLNQHIQQATQADALKGDDVHSGGELADRSEMKSLRRFREVWSRIAAEDQVDKAIGRGPENAGPLNSHLLVLRSLALMRDLSPDYLQRFLSQMDSLLWLDQANQQHAVGEPKPARRSRK
jgi:hypothetical protein